MNWELQVEEGWRPLVKEAVEKIIAGGGTITQVKEKFGELRIYFYADDYTGLYEIADEAEKQSAKICEYCGKPGKKTDINGWIRTVCEEHKSTDIESIRKSFMEKLANEIVNVQPMPNTVISDLYKASSSEKELKEQGYKPVSNLGLMWIKKND